MKKKNLIDEAKIKKAIEDNPDLSREAVIELLESLQESKEGKLKLYTFGAEPKKELGLFAA